MKKKVLKIFIIIVIIFLMVNVTFAGGYIPQNPTPSLGDIDNLNVIQNTATNLIGALMWFGYIAAIGMVIFIGIKYVIASADERASMKGMLVKVAIGSLIIVTSITIVNIVMAMLHAPTTQS